MLAGSLGAGAGIISLGFLGGFCVLLRRWRRRMRERAANRHVQLNDAGAFTFGQSQPLQTLARPLRAEAMSEHARVDHHQAAAAPGKAHKKRPSAGARAAAPSDDIGGAIAPLEWGLAVSSPTASTC